MGYDRFKRLLFLEAGFGWANFTLLNGVFLIGFALALGANNLQVGIIVAIPLLANLVQLISAYVLETTGTKKWTSIIGLFIGRSLWVIIALMGYGVIQSSILVFALVLTFSSLSIAIGNLAVLSWQKDIVPMEKLARFLGKRNIYASAAGIVAYVAGSFLIDILPGLQTYSHIFLGSVVVGIIALVFLFRIEEKGGRIKAISPKKYLSRIRIPFEDKMFLPLLRFNIIWGFVINFSAPFFIVFMLEDMGLAFLTVSGILVLDTLARIYGLSVFRKLGDSVGAKPLLLVTTTITSIVPLAFVLVTPETVWLLPIIFALSAISFAGSDIAVGQALFKMAPREHDAYYLSAFSSLSGFASAIGPIAGGLFATLLKGHDLGFITPLKALFIVGFNLRVATLPLVGKIEEPKAGDVDDIIGRLRTLRFASFIVNTYSFASYTSKIVLVPQKQFFILQRKTANRMKKDVQSMIELMDKIASSVSHITKKNVEYYSRRIKDLDSKLRRQIYKLSYLEGTDFLRLPVRLDMKLRALSKDLSDKKVVAKEIEGLQKLTEGYEQRIEKQFEKDF